MRLLFHGRLKMNIKEFEIVLSASRDPNNTTEKMVIVWEDFFFDWTNGRWNLRNESLLYR